MSRSLVKRFVPYMSARIRENHRMLNRYSSVSSALKEASSSPSSQSESSSLEAVHLSDNCIRRMKELQSSEPEKKMLRLAVETGGCSGFQYVFELDHSTNPDDRVFEEKGVKLVVDNVSYDFVKGATIDYVDELIRSAFVVAENPAAVGGCSCKSSFMVKL
ncbi:iron-sulfur assembly protein IscA-like 2, mitochondrial [Brassica rapa]|uniref:Core domain-containing protein n=1 Tax=Brassica campestris TaxID=3711 RepID=M4EJ45_BRACM|nr:iron-sulfur assembly protein IscA-like 2, mitochondrial [Brassica rapa]